MVAKLPESHKDLFEEPVVVTLATVMPDGQPHLSPMWCEYDGEHILFSTVVGRQKEINVRTNRQATVMALDPRNPYRYIELRGRIIDITEEGAYELIDREAKAYRDVENYYGGILPADARQREQRIVLRFEPEHVVAR